MDIVDALDGFCLAEKRSASLDGSAPLRAVQGCKPFLDANAAGVQLRLADTAVLETGEQARLHLAEPVADRLTGLVPDALERLCANGYLVRDGYWHTRLRNGIAWRESDGRLWLWSGLLARAGQGEAVLVGGAYNRRCQIAVTDRIIDDTDRFTPVVLELDTTDTAQPYVLLDTELACLTGLSRDVSFEHDTIDNHLELGHAFNQFYSDDYIQVRAKRGQTGKYRRLVRNEPLDGPDHGTCQLILLAGPECRHVTAFDDYLTAEGTEPTPTRGPAVNYATIAAAGRISGQFHDAAYDLRSTLDPTILTDRWQQLYGPGEHPITHGLADYINRPAPPLREPYLTIMPWVFIKTTPGWSTIIDGHHTEHIEGLRGIISTDLYPFDPGPVLKAKKQGHFAIEPGQPLVRVLPTARRILTQHVTPTTLS